MKNPHITTEWDFARGRAWVNTPAGTISLEFDSSKSELTIEHPDCKREEIQLCNVDTGKALFHGLAHIIETGAVARAA